MIFGVTGHRDVGQEPGGFDGFARLSVARMIDAGCTELISGMAWGWDISVALACCEVNLPFVAMLPFPDQARHWPEAHRALYVNLLAEAKRIEVVGRAPLTINYFRRDQRIVDQCVELWALDSGRPSGSHTTVLYAKEVGRKIVPLWTDWLRHKGGMDYA